MRWPLVLHVTECIDRLTSRSDVRVPTGGLGMNSASQDARSRTLVIKLRPVKGRRLPVCLDTDCIAPNPSSTLTRCSSHGIELSTAASSKDARHGAGKTSRLAMLIIPGRPSPSCRPMLAAGDSKRSRKFLSPYPFHKYR